MTRHYGVLEMGFLLLQTPNKTYLKSLFPDSAGFSLIIAIRDTQFFVFFTESKEGTMSISIFKEKFEIIFNVSFWELCFSKI